MPLPTAQIPDPPKSWHSYKQSFIGAIVNVGLQVPRQDRRCHQLRTSVSISTGSVSSLREVEWGARGAS
jgi:hypothetical protein